MLVTGTADFIGLVLVEALLATNPEIVSVDPLDINDARRFEEYDLDRCRAVDEVDVSVRSRESVQDVPAITKPSIRPGGAVPVLPNPRCEPPVTGIDVSHV